MRLLIAIGLPSAFSACLNNQRAQLSSMLGKGGSAHIACPLPTEVLCVWGVAKVELEAFPYSKHDRETCQHWYGLYRNPVRNRWRPIFELMLFI